jgi:hypothetical protein
VTDWLSGVDRWVRDNTDPFKGLFGTSEADQKKAQATGQAPSKGILTGPTESLLSGMAWLRDNAISHPITSAQLMLNKAVDDPGVLTNGNEWSKSWNASQHISPGQAIMGTFFASNPEDAALTPGEWTRKIEAAPLEYKRPQGLPQGFNQLPWQEQQDALKNAGMPVQGNSVIQQERRESDFFKYGTGTGDFLLAQLDPTIVGGKAVGGIKRGLTVSQVDRSWTGLRIDQEMARSNMVKAQDFIWTNRDKPQLLNNLPLAADSAMGPRFGAIASKLQNPEEVNLFLRTGMGDTRAMDELAARNAQAAQIIESDTSRLPALDLMHSRYVNNPAMQSMIEREMARVSSRINSNVDMVGRYNQVLDSAHEIDKIALTRWSFAKAEAETEAQNAYAAGAARKAGPGARNLSFTAQRSIGTTGNPMERRVVDPLPGGGSVAATRIYSNFFSTPLTVLRSFGEYRPNGHINLQSIDQDSVNELRGYLARIPGVSGTARARMVNAYLATGAEGERANLMDGIERQAMRSIAARHGFTPEEADALWKTHQAKQAAEKGALAGDNQYSTVKMPGTEPGEMIRVDNFQDSGGAWHVHPNLASRLINSRQMLDLDRYDTILSRNASALKALRVPGGSAVDWVERSGDFLNSAWKFGTLFRLGYIPRVLGDDLGGQMARLGAATMAVRAGWGIKNGATNVARAYARPFLQARQAVAQQGHAYAQDELDQLAPQITAREAAHAGMLRANQRDVVVARNRVARAQALVNALDPADLSPKALATRQLLNKHQGALGAAQLRANTGLTPGHMISLNDLRLRQGYLQKYQQLLTKSIADDEAAQQKVFQGSLPVDIAPDFRVPGALSGQRGQMYQGLLSSQATLDTIYQTNKQLLHGNLMRSWDHGAVPVTATADIPGHMAAWQHVINAQFGNDALARQALAGNSVSQMANWLSQTAEGIAYRKRLGENLTTADDLARRVHYDVNEVAPTPEIRAAALTPDGVDANLLERQFPNPATRPDVHRGQIAANLAGGNQYRQGLGKIMDSWFKWAATVPADRLSRHPLFNQMYSGHAQRIADQEIAQGRTLTTAADAERIAESARRLALRDTRSLVFDIAHRSDAAAAMRFISPFFSATTEAWQRWGRILADKPEVVGYAGKFFNTPLAMGAVQDKDGNPVDAEGYAYDPVTKQRKLVGKTDRRIVMRLPKFLVEGHNPIGLALGASPAGDINLSQDSMNLVLAGDPWFNPGQGPIVTIPVSEWVRDKPDEAAIAKEIGILPFGPSTSTAFGGNFAGRVLDQALPRTIKDFLTAYDTSDDRYQGIKAQVMQRAAFEHANLGKPMPSASEIAARTRNYWLFAATSAFLGPVAGTGTDPYQFYRDEYNKMVRSTAQNPKDQFGRTVGPSADDQFLSKYGESYFVFAQTMSKNKSGAPATEQAVALSRKYADLIAANPDLGSLIIGPEGNGPFSPGAYSYQLNTPLEPGSAEMQRVRLSADDAMAENQKRLGWAKYTAKMNDLHAKLITRGLTAFTDPGAEDLLQQKRGYTALYSKPLFPDGTQNPYYIAAWAKDFNSYDNQKYNELIPGLTALARSDLAKQPARSDLRILQEYLGSRQWLNQQLAARKRAGGDATLSAQANEDLQQTWIKRVMTLVEADTSFGDLYHRYLSRDMGTDVLTGIPQEVASA